MRLEELFEEPDFGYTKFNNEEDKLRDFEWEIINNNKIIQINAKYDTGLYSNQGRITAEILGDTIKIYSIGIGEQWRGTGLGQLLYDHLISWAKKAGYLYVASDFRRSEYANKAWAKLANRYPVKKVKDNDGNSYFEIDLTKVPKKVMEAPDFGYKSFVNRDADIAKLLWNVEFEKSDKGKIQAIIVRALTSNGKHREGVIYARVSDLRPDTMQITRSQLTQYKTGEPSWASTGLGQMLYDKAIAEVKKAGFKYLISDYSMSVEARKAWKKLTTRYPVTIEREIFDDGSKCNIFKIDLDKV